METCSADTLIGALNWRYATKKFDPTRRIPEATWTALQQSLVLTPSSYGLQPWRFIVVTDPGLKAELSVQSWGQTQPRDCSHFVVMAARRSMDEAFVDQNLARAAEVRGIPVESLARLRQVIVGDVVHGDRGKAAFEWATRQVYIALGQFMGACALLGVDTCPMEGIVPAEFDRVLGLHDTGYATVVACAAGYRAADDKYATIPKVRFPADQVVFPRV